MSVYICVRDVKLKNSPVGNVKIVVFSPDHSCLELSELPASKELEWNSSLICSYKQRQLSFQIFECRSDDNSSNIGRGMLHFHNFQMKDGKQTLYEIVLKNLDEEIVGHLNLAIFYTTKKNFLGPMELYNLGLIPTTVDERGKKSTVKTFNSSRLLHGKQQIEGKELIFYKGSCKKKNVFSCMDQSINSEQFQIVEDHYRLT